MLISRVLVCPVAADSGGDCESVQLPTVVVATLASVLNLVKCWHASVLLLVKCMRLGPIEFWLQRTVVVVVTLAGVTLPDCHAGADLFATKALAAMKAVAAVQQSLSCEGGELRFDWRPCATFESGTLSAVIQLKLEIWWTARLRRTAKVPVGLTRMKFADVVWSGFADCGESSPAGSLTAAEHIVRAAPALLQGRPEWGAGAGSGSNRSAGWVGIRGDFGVSCRVCFVLFRFIQIMSYLIRIVCCVPGRSAAPDATS